MLSDNQVVDFQRDGFLNAGPMLSEDTVQALSDELDRIIALGPDGFSENDPKPVAFRDLSGGGYTAAGKPTPSPAPVWQIINIWEASKTFEALIYHPEIATAISQLAGHESLQIWHDQVQYKPAGVGGHTGWHQDAPKWPSIEPMTPVSAWIPLDDAEISNGCMWMVPGSHTWGEHDEYLNTQKMATLNDFSEIGANFEVPQDADIKEIKAVPCPVRRGEVHFHHSLTWHGSPRNTSDRKRRALAIHYMTGDAVYTGKRHLMSPFIKVRQGERMRKAGPHFPRVMRKGVPVLNAPSPASS